MTPMFSAEQSARRFAIEAEQDAVYDEFMAHWAHGVATNNPLVRVEVDSREFDALLWAADRRMNLGYVKAVAASRAGLMYLFGVLVKRID